MERSTMVAGIASGVLVLVAGVGAVAAVGSLQDASQEALAIGQAQPQTPAASAAEVSGAVSEVEPLKKPKVKGPGARAAVESDGSGRSSSGSPSGVSSGVSSGSSGKSAGQSSSGSASSSKSRDDDSGKNNGSGSRYEDSDDDRDSEDHAEEDHAEDREDESESERDDDD